MAKNRARNAARNMGSGMAKKAGSKIISRMDRLERARKAIKRTSKRGKAY